ncbi:hypothetical protein DFR50_10946 [Roseiarcus fermentans]|uniref:Uncharacterized protein n=1 Tax=Roseiarcus fermentans TaxID=1473586 RepID=A0A366FHZ3_9HYPH|nr:hypothetical protein [Roseiarcus fermentans]RBP14293.1 hypothetical protein DFR50_10946 [Roseiarcus fermentans]
MPNRAWSRRIAQVALGVAAALGAAAFAGPSALAQGPVRVRAVQVDVAALRANVGDPTAAWVAQAMPQALVQSLGANYAPGDRGGATLIVRPAWVYLCPSSGGAGVWGTCPDTMEGDIIVKGPRGGVVAEMPLRAITTYYPNSVNISLPVQSNMNRINLLSQAFAGWVPRQLGL